MRENPGLTRTVETEPEKSASTLTRLVRMHEVEIEMDLLWKQVWMQQVWSWCRGKFFVTKMPTSVKDAALNDVRNHFLRK